MLLSQLSKQAFHQIKHSSKVSLRFSKVKESRDTLTSSGTCQRGAKELGSHPCQSKDRFYSLFSQQPAAEELHFPCCLKRLLFYPTSCIYLVGGLFHWSGDHAWGYSHPMDMAAPAIPGRGWGTAQTSNMGGGLPDIISASPIATVSAWFKKAFLTQVNSSASPNPCIVWWLGGRAMYQKLSIAVNKN